MTGQSAGLTGVGSTIAGVAILPNTGNNIALTILSLTTITVGVVLASSFVVRTIVTRFYK